MSSQSRVTDSLEGQRPLCDQADLFPFFAFLVTVFVRLILRP